MNKINLNNFIIKIDNYNYFNTFTKKILNINDKIENFNKFYFLKNQSINLVYKHLFKPISKIKISIIPTFKCNLSCDHCYVKNNIIDININENIKINSNNIKLFVKKILNKYNINNIDLSFTGGECLLNYDLCNNILIKLKKFLKSNKIKYSSAIATNLYIDLDNYIINFLKQLDKIMISVDGPEYIHNNQKKSYFNNENSFRKTIQNIIILQKHININKIYVQGAITKNDLFNKNVIYDFVYIMKKLNINENNFSIGHRCPTNINDDNYEIDLEYFKNHFFKLKIGPYSYFNRCCGFRYMSNFIISPNGNISTNYHDINNSIIGNLNSTINELEINYKKYILNNMPVLKDESCMNCPALNYCWGKCFIYSKYLYKNNPSKYCDRKKIINLLKKSIKNKYRRIIN